MNNQTRIIPDYNSYTRWDYYTAGGRMWFRAESLAHATQKAAALLRDPESHRSVSIERPGLIGIRGYTTEYREVCWYAPHDYGTAEYLLKNAGEKIQEYYNLMILAFEAGNPVVRKTTGGKILFAARDRHLDYAFLPRAKEQMREAGLLPAAELAADAAAAAVTAREDAEWERRLRFDHPGLY